MIDQIITQLFQTMIMLQNVIMQQYVAPHQYQQQHHQQQQQQQFQEHANPRDPRIRRHHHRPPTPYTSSNLRFSPYQRSSPVFNDTIWPRQSSQETTSNTDGSHLTPISNFVQNIVPNLDLSSSSQPSSSGSTTTTYFNMDEVNREELVPSPSIFIPSASRFYMPNEEEEFAPTDEMDAIPPMDIQRHMFDDETISLNDYPMDLSGGGNAYGDEEAEGEHRFQVRIDSDVDVDGDDDDDDDDVIFIDTLHNDDHPQQQQQQHHRQQQHRQQQRQEQLLVDHVTPVIPARPICAVCHSDLLTREPRGIPCRHVYCTECIYGLYITQLHPNCPICRESMGSVDESYPLFFP